MAGGLANVAPVPSAWLVSSIREAALAAAVALVLAIPLAGLKTVQAPGGLALETRWHWVAIAVAAVFTGRLLLIVARRLRRPRVAAPAEAQTTAGLSIAAFSRTVGPLAIAFAVVLPFLPFADRYVLDVSILVLTYIMLGWGLNIVVGLAGLLDLGYVAFYAVGAYSYALFALNFDLGFWTCLPIAGALAACFGILLGFPVLRLRGDYLAIVTLGFGEMIRIILNNWQSLTNGPQGLAGVPRPTLFGLPFSASAAEGQTTFASFFGLAHSPLQRVIFLYYVILGLALLTNLFTMRIRRLPVGRAWEALREDEIACRSLGINPTSTKLTAFSIGAMFAGFAGSFFATRQGFISPESFTFIESAIILAIVVLGGMGSQLGVVIAAVVLIGGPELVRELEEFRMLAFGGLMVLIMLWRPRGLLAHREPTLRLATRPAGAAES
jgi:branched-chain amino acid transport system permease protein